MKSSIVRQRERRFQLDQVARSLGYPTWSKLETAVISQQVKITITGGHNENQFAPVR